MVKAGSTVRCAEKPVLKVTLIRPLAAIQEQLAMPMLAHRCPLVVEAGSMAKCSGNACI